MTDDKKALLNLLKSRSFRTGEFTLASGATSNYFIDCKMTIVSSGGAYLVGRVLYDLLKDIEIDAMGGPQVGAIPLVTATVIKYHHEGRAMEGFWVRPDTKDHGTKKLIEGCVKAGDRVVIMEDVSTTGASALRAVEAVKSIGCSVVAVVTLVDRLQGARELFQANDLVFYPVFLISDLM